MWVLTFASWTTDSDDALVLGVLRIRGRQILAKIAPAQQNHQAPDNAGEADN